MWGRDFPDLPSATYHVRIGSIAGGLAGVVLVYTSERDQELL